MNRNLMTTLLILLSCLLAACWTFRVQSASGHRGVIKFAYIGSPEDARHLSALRFKEQVERESDGSLRVDLYYAGRLGGDRDAIEGVILGTLEMTVAGAGIFANFEPVMGVTALPFLFDDFEEAWAFLDSPLGRDIDRRLLQSGIRVLAYWDNGFRCVTNSVRPLHSPDDLRGLTIRTPENPVVLATMSALGANPSPLPWPELYMALQQGAFDGQENPIPTIYINKLYEVQKYLSITNHVYEPMPVVISDVVWGGLTKREQAVIEQAARDSQEFNRQWVSRQTTEMLAQLEAAGVVVSHPDRAPFQEATRGIHSQFAESIGRERVEQAARFIQRRRAALVRERTRQGGSGQGEETETTSLLFPAAGLSASGSDQVEAGG